ncbi:hypothetical protein CR513_54086, partial [Mucuna pruriens]
MADDYGIITGGPGEDTAVADVVFDIANDGTFGDGSEGQDVANNECGFLAAVDELAGVEAFGGDEEFGLLLVPEGVAEGDLGQRSTATGVVDDLGHHALQVPVPFTEVEAAEPRRTLAVVGVGLEHRTRTLTLCTDDPSHHDSPPLLCSLSVPRRWKG